MATLTATQRTDFQADLGIDATEAVFTNDELDRIYTRADSDYNTAVYLAWRQLLAASTKYIDYKVAQTSISRSQAFANIKEMVAFWQGEARSNANQLRVLGMTPVPTKHKPKPGTEYISTKPNRSHVADW